VDLFQLRDLRNADPQVYGDERLASAVAGRRIRRGPSEIVLAGAAQFRTATDVTASWSHGWKATDREMENNRNLTSAVVVAGEDEIDLTCTFTAAGDVAFVAAVWG
jgi:hypothetical protein